MRLEKRIILLTFLFIILLTAVAGILVILGMFPKADPQFGRWVYGVLFVEILGAVVAFFRIRPRPESMLVNIVFPESIEPQTVELDERNCSYEIIDKDGNPKPKSPGPIMPTRGPGGYQCRLSSDVNPNDYVKLNLVERNGTQWVVGYFSPSVTNQDAKRPD